MRTRYLIALLLLTGCVVPLGPQHFEKPAMNTATRQQDFLDCQYNASFAYRYDRGHVIMTCMAQRGYIRRDCRVCEPESESE